MHNELTRRDFFGFSAAIGVAGAGLATAEGIQPDQTEKMRSLNPIYPTTASELANQMVGVCHFSESRVRDLLQEDRSLALAARDWGFGDWESALGAASHVGNHEIVGLLIAEGARPNLFTYAMLDQVDAVRAVCEAMPGAQRNLGPHGISLMTHAKHGDAERVQDYLESLGGADDSDPGVLEDDETLERFEGEYLVQREKLVVERHPRGWLGIKHGDGSSRPLRRLSALEFSPSGAPHVRVSFTENGDHVTGLSINRPGQSPVTATRSEG